MARPRKELDAILRACLGSSNVYFDPPESFKLKYPCIVYSFNNNANRFADDKNYSRIKRYTMIYITMDPDDQKIDALDDIEYCRLTNTYSSNGLFHYTYELYF